MEIVGNVAGIDPSLSNTAIVAGGESAWHARSCSSKPTGKTVAARFARYSSLVGQVVTLVEAHRCTHVFIEGYSFGHNMAGHHDIVEYGSLLRYGLLPLAQVFEVAPATLKKFATGKGNAQKVAVVGALSRKYDVAFQTDDEYDAFALYLLGLCVAGVKAPANSAQQACVETVLASYAGATKRPAPRSRSRS